MDYNKRTFNGSNLTQELEDDFISNMPENVITYILDRVPILYAVRTSILSRKWRFKWTLLSELTFDTDFISYLREKEIEEDFGRIVNRILVHQKGDITKFSVWLCINLDSEFINDWVMLLSLKRIKHLIFMNFVSSFKFPTHLFSCLELEHLVLWNCSVSHVPSTFHGFPNLLSLNLYSVVFESCKFGKFLTFCPLLEILLYYDDNVGIKIHEITKLTNLRELRLPLRVLGNTAIITSFDFLQHMSLFSKLQELYLDFLKCKVLVKYKERFETLLPCLKVLEIYHLDFSCANMVSLAYALIFASRNMRRLHILVRDHVDVDDMGDACDMADVDYHRMGQLQLRKVSLNYVTGSENEILLLKYLLSSSPFLKQMIIIANSSKVSGGLMMLSKKLLKLHRASPVAEVHLY